MNGPIQVFANPDAGAEANVSFPNSNVTGCDGRVSNAVTGPDSQPPSTSAAKSSADKLAEKKSNEGRILDIYKDTFRTR